MNIIDKELQRRAAKDIWQKLNWEKINLGWINRVKNKKKVNSINNEEQKLMFTKDEVRRKREESPQTTKSPNSDSNTAKAVCIWCCISAISFKPSWAFRSPLLSSVFKTHPLIVFNNKVNLNLKFISYIYITRRTKTPFILPVIDNSLLTASLREI